MAHETDWKQLEPMVWQDGYAAHGRDEPREQQIDDLRTKAAWQAGWDAAATDSSA